ncbi:MAG: lysophospholipid acyltransferase family protein [Candidatus Loosdrechtia sp.]|uniref:lysophospholipid acyltransferase family protein n=1 Tax=Candidatus Loosdrechtia sp. TaxID=3101272 RepID=UPI003A6F1042|nr:MAG: lysophospholipid acyltransferase family protein [Candidatus Jettenia sp. AMX2]
MRKLTLLIIGVLGACIIRLLVFTIRVKDVPEGFTKKIKNIHAIYAVWHCMILAPAYTGKGSNVQVLISQHSDGEYIAQVVKRLGFGVIRGSTTRGGMRALKALIDKAKAGYSLAITPDGPRGPRFVVQSGGIYLGKKTQLPIIPIVIGLSGYWELRSWDRFRIPKPFSRALIMYGEPIYIPSEPGKEDVEYYRLLLEKTMREMADKVDKLA